jgi:hypothetical protein
VFFYALFWMIVGFGLALHSIPRRYAGLRGENP